MFRHHSNYSTAPVSPVSPSPYIPGGGSTIIYGAETRSRPDRSGEAGRAPHNAGPSVTTDIRTSGLAPEQRAELARESAARDASREGERAYAALGRDYLRSGGGRSEASEALSFASLQSAAPAAVEHASGQSLHNTAPTAEEQLGDEAGSGKSGETSSSSGEARHVSGGEERRSATRTFAGSSSSPEGGGDGDTNTEEGSRTERQGSGPEAELSEEERRVVEEMKKRDKEVRRHEQAHLSAGAGIVAGGASYETTAGPDGKQYAVGGEVQIDSSEADSPDATIDKARKVRSAALAPAEPSGQDRLVAAQASQMETDARIEKREEVARDEESPETDEETADPSAVRMGEDAGRGAESGAAVGKAAGVAASAYRRASGVQPPALYGMAFSLAV